MTLKKTGILTGGGDRPGLDAVIRAVARRAPPLSKRLFADAELSFG